MSSSFVQRGAQGYEAYMGRWSRRLAPMLIDFAGAAGSKRVLDVGCGTGNPSIATIEAIDCEEVFVDALRQRNSDPRIHAQRGDACALPYAAASFDQAFSLLVLHFVTDPQRAVGEMRRVLRPGGIAAAAVWDLYGGFPRLFWDTFAALMPEMDERRGATLLRFTSQPGELATLFAEAGFVDIDQAMLPIRIDFASFDDYWLPQIAGQGMLEAWLTDLPAEMRARVESRVRAAYLCNQPDGPRSRAAVAWAVKARVPDQ
jgi:SAM-dependent methyltransferase